MSNPRKTLEALDPSTPVLFISDPVNEWSGGFSPFECDEEQVKTYFELAAPKTVEGFEIATAGELLGTHDFGTYEDC